MNQSVIQLKYKCFTDESIDGSKIDIYQAKTIDPDSFFHPMSINQESESELIKAIKDVITFEYFAHHPEPVPNQKFVVDFVNQQSLNFSFIALWSNEYQNEPHFCILDHFFSWNNDERNGRCCINLDFFGQFK